LGKKRGGGCRRRRGEEDGRLGFRPGGSKSEARVGEKKAGAKCFTLS
jgi:hypothetical protein